MAENISQDIEALEKAEVDAIIKNDLETLGRLWSDDLIAASNENLILTKRQLFALFDGGLIQVKSLERHFSKTFVTGSSAFVVGHQRTVSKIGSKAGLVEYSSYLSSWICKDGVWRLAARHSAAMARLPDGNS